MDVNQKCSSCISEFPSLNCVNCGSNAWNYVPRPKITKRREPIVSQYAIQGFFGEYRPLSNYDTTPFEINGVVFKSAEHAFHYCKASEHEWKEKILSAETPSIARKLGQQCPMRADWEFRKVGIVTDLPKAS